MEALRVGSALGLAFFLWLPYLFSRGLGISLGARLGLAVLILLAAAVIFFRPIKLRWPKASLWPGACLALMAAALGALLYLHSLRERAGGLWSAGVSCEDMGVHATLANAFLRSHERLLRPTFSIFPDWPLGYPFLSDFSASALMAVGVPIGLSFFIPGVFALSALFLNLHGFARRWLSPWHCVLAVFLFLFGGNLGIIYLLRGGDWLGEYSNNWDLSLHYGNMATTVLLPMRTSLFGAPIAVAFLALLCRRGRPALTSKLAAGLLLGSLPLINAHSFLISVLCGAVYILRAPLAMSRRWWPAILLGAVLALPQLYWIRHQLSASDTPFIRPANGFLFDTSLSWPVYWLLNGGLFVPLGVAAWFLAGRGLRRGTLPLVLILPLALTVSFQPNPFDNIKILLFFHFGAALLIADLFRRGASAGRRALAVGAVLVCTATGVHSWIREAHVPCEMAGPASREFADFVVKRTDERSRILTAQHYTHPVPFLAGRTIILGFHNWLSHHGIPFKRRAADVAAIYSGGPKARELIAEYGITDVVVGPDERREFSGLNERFLAGVSRRKEVFGEYALYRLQARP